MRRHLQSNNPPPKGMTVGTLVNYFSALSDKKPSVEMAEIRSEPWILGGVWVIKIKGIAGGVSVGCLEVV